MPLSRLEIHQFRNIGSALLRPAHGLTVLLGANAQGKTNCLEAVMLLLTGLPLRGQPDREMVQWGTEGYRLNGDWSDDAATVVRKERSVALHPWRRRETGPRLPAVAFGPNDVLLVKGSPEGRRRFLDELGTQVWPRYGRELRSYQRLLTQRNRALKTGADDGVVKSFEPLLAQAGSYVWDMRRQLVESLANFVPWVLGPLAPGEQLDVRLQRGGHASVPTAAAFLAELETRRVDERLRGMTLTGPHRDDLVLLLEGRPAETAASQGQQRTIALALKLAAREALESAHGRRPVVLLDDVLSELDARRQEALLELVGASAQQTFVTDTDGRGLVSLAGACYAVESGKVREA